MAPNPQVSVAGWRFDLAKIPKVIGILEASRDDAAKLAHRGQRELEMQPMAKDDVSTAVAEVLTRKNREGAGSTLKAVQSLRDELDSIVNQLRAIQRQYRLADETSGTQFRRSNGA